MTSIEEVAWLIDLRVRGRYEFDDLAHWKVYLDLENDKHYIFVDGPSDLKD